MTENQAIDDATAPLAPWCVLGIPFKDRLWSGLIMTV